MDEKLDLSFIDENEPDAVPYTKLPRTYGDGELRLGEYLVLNEDIYSLGFAILIRNEIIDEALIKEEATRPKTTNNAPRTPKGSFKADMADDPNALD